MTRYILRRVIQSIPTFFGITILSYLLMLGAPGGPVAALTFDPKITPQQREAYAARLGVNDPFPVQYLRWLLGDDWMRWDTNGDGIADRSVLIPLDADGDGNAEEPGTRLGILRGDFGNSFFQRRPVLDIVLDRLPATFELGAMALMLSIVLGIPIGILAAIRRGRFFDSATRVMAVLFNAIPAFWLGLILILVFGSALGLLPMGNRCGVSLTGGCPPIYQRLNYLLLPTLVLAAAPIASYSRFMRASMLETVSKDYIRTAQAKGLSARAVWFRHGARNALIPVVTVVALRLGFAFGGTVVVETVFSYPGLGRLIFEAVAGRDYPVMQATFLVFTVAVLLSNLLADYLYPLLDPRARDA